MLGLRRSEERAIQATPWGDWGASQSTWAGQTVTSSSSLQLLTVFGCVRLIADSISTLPVDVYRLLPDGEREPVTAPRWITQPTAYLDRAAWTTQVITSLLLAGNAYCYIGRDPGSPGISELLPIDPGVVQVRKDAGQPKTFYVAGRPYSNFEILHIPAVMFPGANVGLSPIEAARQSIGTGMSAQEYGARFFSQGASLSGVIETPGELTPEKASQMAAAWARKHSGLSKSHLPGVLEGGASWKSTGVTNEQAQFLETRRYTAAEIAGQMFLVDPSELGIGVEGTSLTYANLEQRRLRLASTTLQPWIVRLENAWSGLLAAPRFAKLNMNAFLRGDLQSRYSSYKTGIEAGFLGADEARKFEDLPPRDDLKPAPPSPGAPDVPAA